MGVPQIGCGCAVCHSTDPHDRRTRTSAIIEVGHTRLLVDTPPELRLQLLGAGVTDIDAVLYTHQHADHVHGIDDLRSFTLTRHAPLPLYGPAETIAHLRQSFNYIFDGDVVPVPGTSKPSPELARRWWPVCRWPIAGIDVLPLGFDHGNADGVRLPGRAGGVRHRREVHFAGHSPPAAPASGCWCSMRSGGASIRRTSPLAKRSRRRKSIGAERTYLTHLTHETSHHELLAALPAGIEPGLRRTHRGDVRMTLRLR